MVELLNSGNIDLGLVEGEVTRQKMVVEKLIPDELLLVVPSYHPWAKKKEISISELTKEPFIFREGGSGTQADDRKVSFQPWCFAAGPENIHGAWEYGSDKGGG